MLLHLCCGDEVFFNHMLDFFAFLVQHPATKTIITIVLKSIEEGSGKGLLMELIADIIGRIFYFHPTTYDDVFGSFNSGMGNQLVIYLDELVWGGNKQNASILKKLYSESSITTNEKYGPKRTLENRFNICISSNDDWVVPASVKYRRFSVMKTDDWLTNQEQEVKYDLANTDRFTFAKFLYERDLNHFNSRQIVMTDELAEQKWNSFNPFMKFIGEIIGNDFTFEVEVDNKNGFGNSVIRKVRKSVEEMKKIDFYEEYRKQRPTSDISNFIYEEVV